MATGLIALLDDVAAIAKVAAASLDDVGAQAAKAGAKAAGVVIDDTAVTPRYVVGFTAERELSIIWRIAKGSLRTKLVFILPGALLLSEILPWLITPILMLGGAYLCFEGAEKVADLIRPRSPATGSATPSPASAEALEDEKVTGAIRTDLILSTEIMVIALAAIEASNLVPLALALAAVGIVITAGVYGVVALIVKADDVGAALARGRTGWRGSVGCALVRGMPRVLSWLSLAGLVAMLWVGGGFLIHGLGALGWEGPDRVIEFLTAGAAVLAGPIGPVLAWLISAIASALLGLAVGVPILLAVRLTRRLVSWPWSPDID